MVDIDVNEYWRGSYESMGQFMAHISDTYNIGRAQLYNYRSTAVALLEAGVTEKEMDKMGINKAKELAKAAKKNDGHVPAKAIETALKPKTTAKDVRQVLFKALNIVPDENTNWFDLDFSSYVTEEEQKTFEDAANAARHGDPVISEKSEPHVQRKQILLKWAQNFLASYYQDVVEGGKGL